MNLQLKIIYNFLKFNFINNLIIKYRTIEYIIENKINCLLFIIYIYKLIRYYYHNTQFL